MIRTVVCEKEGCSGNTFFIETQGNNLVLTCEHCKSKYEFDISYYDFIILSNCSKCNNDTFKVFRDTEKEGIYAKCTECGGTPEKIYIDSDGIQVSYEAKLLNDIKELMYQLDQRICNLEVKLQDLEGSQGIMTRREYGKQKNDNKLDIINSMDVINIFNVKSASAYI